MTTLSIIIPTYNGSRYIDALANAISIQSIKPLEVIVFDSSSTDNTVELCQRNGFNVVIIPKSEFSHGGTRNRAVAMSHGDILIFLTQDALPIGDSFICNLISRIVNGSAVASYARRIPYHNAYPPEVFNRHSNYPLESHIRKLSDISKLGYKGYFFSDVASAVLSSVFNEVGGFPMNCITFEDMALCSKLLRAGHSISYESSSMVYHSHNYKIHEHFKRYFDAGVFFESEKYLMEGAKTGSNGLKMFRSQIKYLLKTKNWNWILYACLEAISKFSSFHLGRKSKYFPLCIAKLFSSNKSYWVKR